MRKWIQTAAAAAALAVLGGCGGGDSQAPTAEENAQLDNAAEMLDASPDSLAVEDAALGNGDAPAETGALPVTGDAATNGAGGNAAETNGQ